MSKAHPATRWKSRYERATSVPASAARSPARVGHAERNSRNVLLLAGLLFGCAAAVASPSDGPEVNFAAHQEHSSLVIDHVHGLGAGEVIAPGWLRLPGAPLHLRAGGRTVAALQPIGPGAVAVRAESGAEALATDHVEPSWENGAIRLILRTATGEKIETGFFERLSAGGAPGRLSRLAETILDVRGTYQAVLRDPDGTSVGWLRVRVNPSGTAVRSYEGLLPTLVTPGLAAAVTLALDTEVDWIEDHSLDVHHGS